MVGQPNAGLTGQGLRLACAEPGDQLAIFGEALRELTERATYLYEEAGRYWFSTQPTLNRLADDRAKAVADQLGTIRLPVVVADGEHDEIIKPEHTRQIAASIKDAQLQIMPDASHFAMLQTVAEFNRALSDFLKGH